MSITTEAPEPQVANEDTQIVIPDILELDVIHSGLDNARIRFTKTKLEFVGEWSFEQWCEAVSAWQKATDMFHIGLADLLEYGKKQFGEEKVDETLELLAFDMADVLKAHAIGQLSLDIRDASLNSEHYYVLAKLLPNAKKEQGRWAAIATKENLTAAELKASIIKGKVIKQAQVEQDRGSGSGVPNIEGLSLVFQRWEKQAGGEEKILEQPPEWKQEFLNQIHPIVDLARKVEASLPKEG